MKYTVLLTFGSGLVRINVCVNRSKRANRVEVNGTSAIVGIFRPGHSAIVRLSSRVRPSEPGSRTVQLNYILVVLSVSTS